MSSINFAEFTWFSPTPKTMLSISIPNENSFNLNPKLMEQMPSYIDIGASSDGHTLCIREKPDIGYKLPKSGSVKAKELIRFLVEAEVRLPAKYIVTNEGNCWKAVLVNPSSPIPTVNTKKPPRKKRMNLSGLAKEVEEL